MTISVAYLQAFFIFTGVWYSERVAISERENTSTSALQAKAQALAALMDGVTMAALTGDERGAMLWSQSVRSSSSSHA